MVFRRLQGAAAVLLYAALLSGSPLAAQDDEKKLGWFDSAEVSLFMTSGNAEAESLALRNTLRRVWEDSVFTLSAGALRAETSTISRVAFGTPQSFEVRESSESLLTAENYFLRGRYDREISETFFWFAGAGWDRNEFAGIKNRMTVFGGVGNVWFDDETAHFRTDYGLTYTDQEDVIPNPAVSDTFLGVRFSWDYGRQLTSTTTYANVFILDGNVDETSDYRSDMTNSLAVAMSEKMALQVSLQWLYDNEPALGVMPLLTPGQAGIAGTVLAPLDDLDTILTASLVVNF